MKLSIQKSLTALLMLMANCTVWGQVPFEINLHLYKPLTKNRVAFEDSILTFYAPYKAGKESHFPIVYFYREDYSNNRTLQPFILIKDGISQELSKAVILKHKNETKKLVSMFNDSKSRQNTEEKKLLFAQKGLRRYDCNFNDKISDKTFHLFLGSKNDPKANHFDNFDGIKKRISNILKDHSEAVIHIHFSDHDKLCYEDASYVNHSVKYWSYSLSGEKYSSLEQQEALKIVDLNLKNILKKIQLTNNSITSIKEVKPDHEFFELYLKSDAELMTEYPFRSFCSETGVYFNVVLITSHEHPRTGLEVDEYSSPYQGVARVSIELNKMGYLSKVLIIEKKFPNFYNERYDIYGGEEAFSPSQAPSEPVQMTPALEPNEDEVLAFVQSEPEYPGGIEKLYEDIYSNITYPEMEKKNKIQGTVYISFIVEKAGSISDIKIERGINGGPNLSKEADKAVRKLKPFKPAIMNGKAVRYRYRIPIKFTLNE